MLQRRGPPVGRRVGMILYLVTLKESQVLSSQDLGKSWNAFPERGTTSVKDLCSYTHRLPQVNRKNAPLCNGLTLGSSSIN